MAVESLKGTQRRRESDRVVNENRRKLREKENPTFCCSCNVKYESDRYLLGTDF